jgi:hypothetical protein
MTTQISTIIGRGGDSTFTVQDRTGAIQYQQQHQQHHSHQTVLRKKKHLY